MGFFSCASTSQTDNDKRGPLPAAPERSQAWQPSIPFPSKTENNAYWHHVATLSTAAQREEFFAQPDALTTFVHHVWAGIPDELRQRVWRLPLPTQKEHQISMTTTQSPQFIQELEAQLSVYPYLPRNKALNELTEQQTTQLDLALRSCAFPDQNVPSHAALSIAHYLLQYHSYDATIFFYQLLLKKLTILWHSPTLQTKAFRRFVITAMGLFSLHIAQALQLFSRQGVDMSDLTLFARQWLMGIGTEAFPVEFTHRFVDILFFDPCGIASLSGIFTGLLYHCYQLSFKDIVENDIAPSFAQFHSFPSHPHFDVDTVFLSGYNLFRVHFPQIEKDFLHITWSSCCYQYDGTLCYPNPLFPTDPCALTASNAIFSPVSTDDARVAAGYAVVVQPVAGGIDEGHVAPEFDGLNETVEEEEENNNNIPFTIPEETAAGMERPIHLEMESAENTKPPQRSSHDVHGTLRSGKSIRQHKISASASSRLLSTAPNIKLIMAPYRRSATSVGNYDLLPIRLHNVRLFLGVVNQKWVSARQIATRGETMAFADRITNTSQYCRLHQVPIISTATPLLLKQLAQFRELLNKIIIDSRQLHELYSPLSPAATKQRQYGANRQLGPAASEFGFDPVNAEGISDVTNQNTNISSPTASSHLMDPAILALKTAANINKTVHQFQNLSAVLTSHVDLQLHADPTPPPTLQQQQPPSPAHRNTETDPDYRGVIPIEQLAIVLERPYLQMEGHLDRKINDAKPIENHYFVLKSSFLTEYNTVDSRIALHGLSHDLRGRHVTYKTTTTQKGYPITISAWKQPNVVEFELFAASLSELQTWTRSLAAAVKPPRK